MKKKRGGKRKGAGRPVTKEPSKMIRVSYSALERITRASERHALSMRDAADMLVEMGEAYDMGEHVDPELSPGEIFFAPDNRSKMQIALDFLKTQGDPK